MQEVQWVRRVRQVRTVQKVKRIENKQMDQLVDMKFSVTLQERYKIQELEAMLWAPNHHDFFIRKYRWLLEWVRRNKPELLDELRGPPAPPTNKNPRGDSQR